MDTVQTEHVKCNLCGGDSHDRWGFKDGIQIVQCNECSLVFANPRPTNEELEKYYSQEYFDEGEYEANNQRQRMYEIEMERWLPHVGDTGRFLDVGCAMGKFLDTLPDTFEKYGIEFSEDAAEMAKSEDTIPVESKMSHV